MIPLIYTLHSYNRWIVLVLLVLTLLKLTMVWMSKGEFAKADNTLYRMFISFLSIQFLLGLILIFSMGFDSRFRIEHAVSMLLATIIAHLPLRWKNAPGAVRAQRTVVFLLVALIFIVVGILQLKRGFFTMTHFAAQ